MKNLKKIGIILLIIGVVLATIFFIKSNNKAPLSLASASPSALESALPITGSALIRSSLDQLAPSFV